MSVIDVQDAKSRMDKASEVLNQEFSKIRTGRAHPGLLDEHVRVPCYGSEMPLNQVANVRVESAMTLVVEPFDKQLLDAVAKAIRESDLGLNPAVQGNVMRVQMPPLTQERRQALIKVVKAEAEQARVSVRGVRRDVLQDLKKQVKEKLLTEDDERRASTEIQKLTDEYIKKIDQMVDAKEADLNQI